MLSPDQRPTFQSMEKAAEHYRSTWRDAHSHFETIDSFEDRTYQVWDGPEKHESYRPSTPTNIIQHAVDNQLAFLPRFHRFPVGSSDEAQAASDRVENWMSAAFEEMSLLEPSLVWKQIGHHLLSYGYTVAEGPVMTRGMKPCRKRGESKANFDSRMDMWEFQHKSEFPFRVRPTHPCSVLMPPMEKRPSWAIKESMRYNYEIAELAEKKQNRVDSLPFWFKEDEPMEKTLVREEWSLAWHAVSTDKQLLYVEPNRWGFIPFAHCYAGFGREPTNVGGTNPRYLAVGILDAVLDSIRVEAQQMSGIHNILMEAVFPKRGTTESPANIDEQLAQSDIVKLQNPGSVWWMDLPTLPAQMFQDNLLVRQDIEIGTYARILAGLREPGVSTVGQQAILSTAANRKFAGPMAQLNHLASIVARRLLRLAHVLLTETDEKRIEVRGEAITLADIKNDYNIQAKFQVLDPVLSLQQRELGMREVGMGLKSKETYWSADAQLEDVSGERKRLWKQLVREDPAVVKAMAAAAASEMGLEDMLDAVSDAAATATGGLAGPGEPMRQPISPENPVAPGQPMVQVPPQGI